MATIIKASPPNLVGQPNIDFNKNAFESLIWNKGYDVIVYRAIQCPCQIVGSTNLSDCENCLGLGQVYINPIQTKAIITAINKDTKFKYWSPEFKGTVAVTLRDIERLAFMDKIILKDKTSILSETRKVKTSGVDNFIFTSYPVNKIESIFIFDASNKPLIKLKEFDEYTLSSKNPYVVKLNIKESFNGTVSITYLHNIQYNVVDIPHDVRSSQELKQSGKMENQELPIQAICQKSHYITGDSPKYDGSGIQDNSYK